MVGNTSQFLTANNPARLLTPYPNQYHESPILPYNSKNLKSDLPPRIQEKIAVSASPNEKTNYYKWVTYPFLSHLAYAPALIRKGQQQFQETGVLSVLAAEPRIRFLVWTERGIIPIAALILNKFFRTLLIQN